MFYKAEELGKVLSQDRRSKQACAKIKLSVEQSKLLSERIQEEYYRYYILL